MKFFRRLLFIAFALSYISKTKAQQLEAGLLINSNPPRSSDNYYSTSARMLPGFGMSFRYNQPFGNPLFRNLAATAEWCRSELYSQEGISPGGAGGDDINIRYKFLQLSLSDYFINFRLFKKTVQFSMGLFANYKPWYRISGSHLDQFIGWDTLHNHYLFRWDKYDISGTNNGTLNPLLYGFCMGIAFRKFEIQEHTFRSRLEFQAAIKGENRFGFASFAPMFLKFSVNMMLNKPMEKVRQKMQFKIKEKGESRLIRKQKRKLRQQQKFPLTNNFDFGGGINMYHSFDYDGWTYFQSGYTAGLNLRNWGKKGKGMAMHLGVSSIRFSYSSWGIYEPYASIIRNTLDIGLYPIHWNALGKRVDFRMGADFRVLLQEQTNGDYYVNGKSHSFQKDELQLNNKFNMAINLNATVPIIRSEYATLLLRYTAALHYGELTYLKVWSNGYRQQAELVMGFKLHRKKPE